VAFAGHQRPAARDSDGSISTVAALDHRRAWEEQQLATAEHDAAAAATQLSLATRAHTPSNCNFNKLHNSNFNFNEMHAATYYSFIQIFVFNRKFNITTT
jgi:hypothetical protein